MKKKICIILSLLLIAAFATTCFASEYINPNLERVIDRAGVLSAEEIKAFEKRAKELSDKYDLDILILTDSTNHGYENDHGYIDSFWDSEGYGKGSSASGIALFICYRNPDGFWYTEATGDATKYVTKDVVNIVDDFMMDYLGELKFAKAIEKWLTEYEKVFEIGASAYAQKTYSPHAGDNPSQPYPEKTPKEEKLEKLGDCAIAAGSVGVVAGLINLVIGLVSMKSVKEKTEAGEYKDKGSFVLRNYHNILLNVSVRREAIPQNNNNNSGGPHHSGGSSFSSHSSGGHMHSGGGRHF